MSEPFLSEIRILSFNFAPRGWAFCNGQLLPIAQNQALFSLLGTTDGGDGRTNFALPNLQGRAPAHMGGGLNLGQSGGEQAHTLSQAEMPDHPHIANAANVDATTNAPADGSGGLMLAKAAGSQLYANAANLVAMAPGALGVVGGTQPHQNMQPFLVLNLCIALQGIFPSRN